MKDETIARKLRFVLDPRLQGLRNIARRVFKDRNAEGMNARGMPRQDRLKIKTEARPHLREAIRHVQKSRDALLAGDVALHECERDRARMYVAFARLEFFQPYANKLGAQYAKLPDISELGGKATAEEYARKRGDLDDLIRGCLQRDEPTRKYAKEWADAKGVSVDTVERAINRVKLELGIT